MLTLTQGKKLIKLARKSIDSWFKKKQLDFSKEKKEFKELQGVFVTLHLNKELRGCIGYPYPSLQLAEAIFQSARSAAFSDPRFDPLTEKEFNKCILEISVLTVPQQIQSTGNLIPDQIELGKDGLIIQFAGHSGLLLPQVATESKLSAIDFLTAVSQKAGLSGDIWLNPQAKLYKFQAQIFSEIKPNGLVKYNNAKIVKKHKKT